MCVHFFCCHSVFYFCIYNEKELSFLASACAGFYPEPSWKKASHNICTEGRIISGYPQGVAHASVINYIRCSYSLHSFVCSCTSNPLDHIFIFVSIIKTTTSNIRISSSLYVSIFLHKNIPVLPLSMNLTVPEDSQAYTMAGARKDTVIFLTEEEASVPSKVQ